MESEFGYLASGVKVGKRRDRRSSLVVQPEISSGPCHTKTTPALDLSSGQTMLYVSLRLRLFCHPSRRRSYQWRPKKGSGGQELQPIFYMLFCAINVISGFFSAQQKVHNPTVIMLEPILNE